MALEHRLAGNLATESIASRSRSALSQVLSTVFGESWVGQQRFTTFAEIDALHASLEVNTTCHVLDLGCGFGGPAIHLAQQSGCRITGIDPSMSHIYHAQAAAMVAGIHDRMRFIAGDFITADFPTSSFDAIVSRDTFMTTPNKARLLACCYRWLRPRGRFAATLIVNSGNLRNSTAHSPMLAWPIPTLENYQLLAELAGLRILEVHELSPSFREIGARWRGALMAWESSLIAEIGQESWAHLNATIGQLAEWASQDLIGHIQLVAVRDS